ncbi:valine--tRNA ligase [Spiroplasma culicicola]|uniref:Valine--tRNA ligase n=1 Tax=Spiroplasma culicicola AES-1 TaxID=1276246 RepID=W6A7S9_9MOLU|nr:valine--tRNA ligase [Spiroplasma culicicola]AHI52930.1 valyl-tRNA synthetase [Spiroplasma culicicola AES-1]
MKKELAKKYDHLDIENEKYDFWIDNHYFEAQMDENKQPYAIVIPPPNVTGKLHLGHAWDYSIQDALIRYKKLNGFDTLLVPGMDHAGIATQAKVEQRLREQGISRWDLGREAFIDKVWEWKEEYASTIRQQWKKLGIGLDYSKEKFTYSPEMNELVNFVFTKMYDKGLIYKSKRIVNWDPQQKTAISNIEVIYKETKGAMYYFKYMLENDSNNFLTIATTRPETMFGDVCVVVNPKDKRYQKYIGLNVINPVNGQAIPVIGDDYVEIDFGTGVMKCTPAHDPNDYIIGEKYGLEKVNCMNPDGTLNELAYEFNGLDRFEVRKQLVEKLTQLDLFIKSEEVLHQVGYSERSNAIVEPYLSEQWFVKMDELAQQVLDLQASDNQIRFYPKRFNEVLTRWMENINDWTISRQLWWGHQIPAWYHNQTQELYVGLNPPNDIENWTRDEDVLDTWFSSALWAFSTLNWREGQLDNQLFNRYFPIDCMVTGYDIIFFWVARMIFQSLEFTKEKPFKDVLIHGLIRDEEGRKMSKSLGNGVDPMDVIDQYGSDSLRHFLLTNSSPGQDIRFSEEKIRSSWNFINKIWNASRFVMMNLDEVIANQEFEKLKSVINDSTNLSDKWILNSLSKTQKQYFEAMEKYEFTIAGKVLYNFIWDDYCSLYLELSKAQLNSQDQNAIILTKATLGFVLKEILIMLHPLMPFVSEEIYQQLDLHTSILEEEFKISQFDFAIEGFEQVIVEAIAKIREFRANQDIKNSTQLEFSLNLKESNYKNFVELNLEAINNYLKTLTNATVNLSQLDEEVTSLQVSDFFLEILNSTFIDVEKQLKELEESKNKLEQEILRSKKMLSNQNFIAKADPQKVEAEKQKAQEYEKQYQLVIDKIANLKK